MKAGMRMPSPTKSLKAKTTGRVKRAVKGSVNPVYGVKGIEYLKDPERAVKNKIYHKITVDPLDSMKKAEMPDFDVPEVEQSSFKHGISYLFAILGFIGNVIFLYKFIAGIALDVGWLGLGIICTIVFLILRKKK